MAMTDQLDIARCWRRLFLNDDGSFRPDAETVMRDIESECGAMRSVLPVTSADAIDPYRAVADLKAQMIYRHIKIRLWGPLDKLIKTQEKNHG